jgi:hypothetical protein
MKISPKIYNIVNISYALPSLIGEGSENEVKNLTDTEAVLIALKLLTE